MARVGWVSTLKILQFPNINSGPAWGRVFLDCSQNWMKFLTVPLGQHRLASRQNRAPECETSVIVDCVIGLGHQNKVRHCWICRTGNVGEYHSVMFDIVLAPLYIITSHYEHAVGVFLEELFNTVKKELVIYSMTLVSRLNKVDIVSSSHMDIHEC